MEATSVSRFEEFKELDDNSGFKIPTGEVFKFDQKGGWFDEYGDYFNQDGELSTPDRESLKKKKKLMEEQKLMTKVKNRRFDKLDNEDIPEYYDVVGTAYGCIQGLMYRIMEMNMIRNLIIYPMGISMKM